MRVIVVGGGAAGLMAGTMAARRGYDVTIVERNDRMARKVMITGKGRCNVTNHCSVEECVAHIPGNGRFLYSALTAFSPQDTQELLESRGLPLKVERGNRVFPVSDKAVDVVDTLVAMAKESGCRFYKGRVTRLCIEEDVCTGVELEGGVELPARCDLFGVKNVDGRTMLTITPVVGGTLHAFRADSRGYVRRGTQWWNRAPRWCRW